jgi:hypothetical protein
MFHYIDDIFTGPLHTKLITLYKHGSKIAGDKFILYKIFAQPSG